MPSFTAAAVVVFPSLVNAARHMAHCALAGNEKSVQNTITTPTDHLLVLILFFES
ncbi:hypothetical protein [Flavobacterium sp. W20_MBD1_R3]|uniref:hypothetical protein n=1 Tax=Flavobacterium sp. W20_MBD1_R3 TaxID=3240278 RepID=UPI003F93B222